MGPVQVAYGDRGELDLRPFGDVDAGGDGVGLEVGDEAGEVADAHE